MWDFPYDKAVQQTIREIYQGGLPVGAVCHGPAALVNVKLSDGTFLLAGKDGAAFANAEEAAAGLTKVVPFLLASKLAERGAKRLSMPRSEVDHFGDSSVWTTTFFLPLLLLGLIAWWMMRIKFKMATGFLLVGLFAIYMALGPSLKVNSKKPPELQKSDLPVSRAMLASHAVMPTGSAWISEHIPGFNVMRASYRWSTLSIFAFWCLLMIWVAMVSHKNPLWCGVVLTIVILF
jgi:small-conductance mechanosensitive channel